MKRTIHTLWCVLIVLYGSCTSSQTNDAAQNTSVDQQRVSTTDSASGDAQNNESSEFHSEKQETTNLTADKERPSEPLHKTERESGVQDQVPAKKPGSLKAEAKRFCDFFKIVDEPSQFYTVPANQIKEVKGNAGTIILVNPDDLATLTNKPVEKPVEVELKELINQEHLLKANAQTVCNGKLLVSGGAYFINLKSDGEPVKLKPGRALSVKFPKLTEEPMTLFTGHRDSLGQMQWQQRKQVFNPDGMQQAWRDSRNTIVQYDGDILEIDTLPKRKPKQLTEKEKQVTEAYKKVYAAMEIQSLGWINCDRFYNIPDKTRLSIKLDEHVPFASIYLIFDDINSIIQTHYGATQNGTSNPGFEDVPVGAKARLVAFSLKDEKMMAFSSPITIKKNETVTVSLKEASDDELKRMMSKKGT
jgi:hypothetical protein